MTAAGRPDRGLPVPEAARLPSVAKRAGSAADKPHLGISHFSGRPCLFGARRHVEVQSRSSGRIVIQSSCVYACSPVYRMIASSSRGPRRSLSWRRPRKSSPLIREPALTSMAMTWPSSRSSTRSTSSPASVRKCPAVTGASDQLACLSTSPTAKVSSRCPYSVRAAGVAWVIFYGVRLSSHAITPESTRCSLGCLVIREPRVREQ
jgi:hypothetical protein